MIKFLLVVGLLGALWWVLRRYLPAKGPLPDEAEARAILGVSDTADADAIRAAHRRLAAAVHPDRGGSADLTRKINAARDVLIKRLG